MTYDKAMKLAEEVFDEEYSGLDKDSFLIGFQEAYNALTTLYKDKFELVKQMREVQKGIYQAFTTSPKEVVDWSVDKARQLESEVDEYLKNAEE